MEPLFKKLSVDNIILSVFQNFVTSSLQLKSCWKFKDFSFALSQYYLGSFGVSKKLKQSSHCSFDPTLHKILNINIYLIAIYKYNKPAEIQTQRRLISRCEFQLYFKNCPIWHVHQAVVLTINKTHLWICHYSVYHSWDRSGATTHCVFVYVCVCGFNACARDHSQL